MSKINDFFRVNEATEAVNTLTMIHKYLSEKEQENYNLKWALIATHNCLQAFMILVLRGSNSFDVIQWKDEYDSKNNYEICCDSNPKMLKFMELFAKIKKPDHMLNRPFVDNTGTISCGVKLLNSARNDFVHYLPKAWSLQIGYVLLLIENSLEVIDFLIDDSRLTVYNEIRKEELKELTGKIHEVIRIY